VLQVELVPPGQDLPALQLGLEPVRLPVREVVPLFQLNLEGLLPLAQ
jgi:hypothetical protein